MITLAVTCSRPSSLRYATTNQVNHSHRQLKIIAVDYACKIAASTFSSTQCIINEDAKKKPSSCLPEVHSTISRSPLKANSHTLLRIDWLSAWETIKLGPIGARFALNGYPKMQSCQSFKHSNRVCHQSVFFTTVFLGRSSSITAS